AGNRPARSSDRDGRRWPPRCARRCALRARGARAPTRAPALRSTHARAPPSFPAPPDPLRMNLQIALLLSQDGITNGAIYALLALALVLLFAVTRVIFIPQGEFVSMGALTLASFQAGRTPGTLWLLIGAGTAVAVVDGFVVWRRSREGSAPARVASIVGWNLAYPAIAAVVLFAIDPAQL